MSNAPSLPPRPEYPRPQFVRESWLNLNGEWEFEFDDHEVGLTYEWFNGRRFPRKIQVPFPYQSELSGINEKQIHEVVWYARDFRLPADWKDCDILLHFGAVDYLATVWVNGKEVGNNRGGHVPFSFDISPYLHHGENRLVVRAVDRNISSQPRGKQSVTGRPHEIDYYCTTGIWQTVWLEPVPKFRIDHIAITPILEESAFELRIYLHAPSVGWNVEVDVLADGEAVTHCRRDVASAASRLFIRIPNARFWSPEDPYLYDLRIRLNQNGERIDEILSYVGLRSVEICDAHLCLNGKKTYLKMVLDQGYWPDGILTAPSDAALRADVEWAKRLGFNGVRKHQKIEDPRWVFWCDRLGLLVWAEMPNARTWSNQTEEALVSEWTRAVLRDYNSPSVVVWVPNNESMGFPDLQAHPGQYAFLERIVNATRMLDPYRPVIDNDGWEHTDVTDICAIHDYTPTGDALRERYAETLRTGKLPATTWLKNKAIFTHRSDYHGQPVMLTEVGGFLTIPSWLPPEEWDVLYDHYGWATDGNELAAKYEDLILGIADLTFVSGFCYTQLTDVEQERNGLLTYQREPKVDPERIAEIHRRAFQSDRVEPPQPTVSN